MSAQEAELQKHLCWAGRWAFLGGRWKGIAPCDTLPIHAITTGIPGQPIILLCDPHFNETNEAGLVDEPFVDPQEAMRRDPRLADLPDY